MVAEAEGGARRRRGCHCLTGQLINGGGFGLSGWVARSLV
jgi:hypothetical protein